MGLESATHISDLVTTNPVGATDGVAAGDDHIRMIKTVLKTDFPNITGAVNATQDNLNVLTGATISSSIGFCSTVRDWGSVSATLTLNPLVGNLQKMLNAGGTITLVPPTVDCTMVVLMTNTSATVAVTSAFTKVSGTFTNTAGDDFFCTVTKIGSFSHLNIVALQ